MSATLHNGKPLNALSQNSPDDRRDLRRRHQIELRIVAQAGGELATSLDISAVLQRTARLSIGAFADVCLIYRLEDGRLRLAAADAERSILCQGLGDLETLELEAVRPIVDALLDGRALLIPNLSVRDDVFARTLRSLSASSVMIVPAICTNGVMAAIVFVQSEDKYPHYDPHDFEIAQAYGRAAGQALLNAHMYSSQRGIAELFQNAHLPKHLPSCDHYCVDALYESATGSALLGGDWYDSFLFDDGRLFLAIGDVQGHGIEAAVLMSKIRQSIRGAALATKDVGETLRIADASVKLESSDSWATAAIAIFAPQKKVLSLARAGHPPPVRYNDERITALALDEDRIAPPPLGLWEDDVADVYEVRLRSGDIVAFFTDGLIEFSRDLYEGYAALYNAMRSEDGRKRKTPAQFLRTAIVPEMHSDDVAVLTLTIH